MEHDLNRRGHLPSRVPLMRLFESSVQEILCATSLVFARPAQKPGENYHAVLEHVKSSIRDSLKGHGHRVAVLNDEAHHVANESQANAKKWKGFLLNPEYGFRLIVGVSGTCYVGDDYFADVVYRYSLREAMEHRFVKNVDYVWEMPPEAENREEKWQLIYKRHEDWNRKLKRRGIRPLTIVVTRDIKSCEQAAEELMDFIRANEGTHITVIVPRSTKPYRTLWIRMHNQQHRNAGCPQLRRPDSHAAKLQHTPPYLRDKDPVFFMGLLDEMRVHV